MNVNGITTGSEVYSAYASASANGSNTTKNTAATATSDTGNAAAITEAAVYEPSNETTTDSAKKTYTQDSSLVAKLKADADARTEQLRSLVEKMLLKQGQAYGTANDIWSFLASGNYTVDAATKEQAQADIAEDGYWGVSQTSSRILDFATALTGGDPDKIEEMREAFKKGYEQAEKTWGGELPEISQKTYDAVMEGFDQLCKTQKEELT